MTDRVWSSNFNSTEEFLPFYITPDGAFGCNHSLSTDNPLEGQYSHKATIISANAADNSNNDYNHRAYPTIELHKTEGGSYQMPCRITLCLWYDIPLGIHGTNDWFSPITLSDTEDNTWGEVVTLSTDRHGYLNWGHTPRAHQSEQIYQAGPSNGGPKLQMRKWVRLDMEVDFDPVNGYAKVWQDGHMVSHAQVLGRTRRLTQIHAGLYTSPAVASGTVYNGIIEIAENSQVIRPYHNYGIGAINSMSGRG
jgi:hypothetical protein